MTAHICLLQSGPDVTRRTRYEDFREAVLRAGRFSVFEATEAPRAARLYDRLCADPEVEVVLQGFPWTGVRKRETP